MVDTLLDPEIALELRNGLVGVEIDADVGVIGASEDQAPAIAHRQAVKNVERRAEIPFGESLFGLQSLD